MNRLLNVLWATVLVAIAIVAMASIRARAAELLMFKEDGCPWCMRFDREVGRIYANTNEGKVAPLKRIDKFEIPEEYRFVGTIVYTPTFVLVDDAGHVIGRIIGYQSFDFFWEELDRLLKKLDAHQAQKAAQRQPAANRAIPRG